jgi:hypothetical protein
MRYSQCIQNKNNIELEVAAIVSLEGDEKKPDAYFLLSAGFHLRQLTH